MLQQMLCPDGRVLLGFPKRWSKWLEELLGSGLYMKKGIGESRELGSDWRSGAGEGRTRRSGRRFRIVGYALDSGAFRVITHWGNPHTR